MACPIRRALSGVMGYSFALPRMPSVPKSLVAMPVFDEFLTFSQVQMTENLLL
jgi:hypothetical protein